jgi:hypothetical protein
LGIVGGEMLLTPQRRVRLRYLNADSKEPFDATNAD